VIAARSVDRDPRTPLDAEAALMRPRGSFTRFAAGALLALALFVAANIVVAHLRSDCGLPGLLGLARCSDAIRRAGFPLPFYEDGGYAYRHHFEPGAFALDVFAGLGMAAIAGWLVQRLAPGRPHATR